MIRQYSTFDHKQILDIYNIAKLDELRHEPEEFELIPLQNDPVRNQIIFQSKLYVLEDKDLIKGFIAINQPLITGLFVLPEFRGQGLAKQLLEYIITHYAKPLTLQVVRSNLNAIYLYQSFGFKQMEDSVAHYNGLPVDILKMSLTHDK